MRFTKSRTKQAADTALLYSNTKKAAAKIDATNELRNSQKKTITKGRHRV